MGSDTASRWVPLESNPDVFNSWAKKAGLTISQARFEDVYGLDADLLGLVPKPVKAVILLFPDYKDASKQRGEEDALIAKNGQPQMDKTILWIKQTIPNACGTLAIIHALANSNVTFAPGSPLQEFIIQCQGKTPTENAHLLETTPLFANIHAESASAGQTRASQADTYTDLHFTCFVEAPEAEFRDIADGKVPPPDATSISASTSSEDKEGGGTGMRLVELDGTRVGPIDRGPCNDLLSDVAKVVKKLYISSSSSVLFNLMALTTAPQ